MNSTKGRELTTRISDLEGALKAIGRIVSDITVTPKRRLDRITGVVSMYHALPEQPPTPPKADA